MPRDLLIPGLVFMTLPGAACAQSADESASGGATAAAIRVEESADHGRYLVDDTGRAVYLFTADQQGQGEDEAAVSHCYGACAQAWPPVLTKGAPEAGEAVMQDLLGVIERDNGATQVTYNGWPLYYYVRDRGAGEAAGQDIKSFGGEWYLLRPGGGMAGHE